MIGFAVLLRLLGGVGLLIASGVFVGSEFSLTRVRQFDREEFTGSRGLERAWEMTERLEIYLSGCQFGITVTSIGLGVIAEPAVTALFEPLLAAVGITGSAARAVGATASIAVINLIYVIVGEQIPTYLGIERTKTVAASLSLPLSLWTRAMYPAIRVADLVTKALLNLVGVPITRSWAEEEAEGDVTSIPGLREEIGRIVSHGSLPEERREEIINAIEIEERPVTEIMVDREDVIALSTADDVATNVEHVRGTGHDRFPLVGESLEDFEGIVYGPLLLARLDELKAGDIDLGEIAAPPMTVAAETPVSDLIDQFQTQNQELALVLEGGEVVGLVTATDAFEAIAGEVSDPLDREDESDS
ncbi:MAG: CNNM domain-containing protein [Haloarculaceae archaeon]